MRLTNSRKVPATSKSTNSGAALTVRYIRQPMHGGALVVRCKMSVLARDCGALVPHNLARDKVRDTGCFQHCHGAVAQRAARNLARFARLIAAFAGALMSARQRLNQSGFNENIPELIRQ